jgi:hypothetical protein
MSLARAKMIMDDVDKQRGTGRFNRGDLVVIELLVELIDSVERTEKKPGRPANKSK